MTANLTMTKIDNITLTDQEEYYQMATEFYSNPCCDHNVDKSHFENAFNFCLQENNYARIFIIRYDGKVAGYGNIAFTYSIEAGGKVVLLEELFIKPNYRNKGIGKAFFDFIYKNYPAKRYRLEVTACNNDAIRLYEKLGYKFLNYKQMIKEN